MLTSIHHTKWRNVAVGAALVVFTSACSSLFPAEPGPDGEIVVELADYRFGPDTIRARAGDTVTFVLRNVGDHTHELMIGRDPHIPDNYLDGPIAEAFEEDFFAGVDVSFSGEGMPMNLTGTDMDAMDMDMPSDDPDAMDMPSDDPDAMDMPTEGDMDMDDDEPRSVVVEPEAEGEEEHAGGMVMVQTGQEARITFTIPTDRVGEWTIACFQEDGGHFADGMRATLLVEA